MTKEEWIAEILPMFNDIGILHESELGRLVGFAEDDSDYYYVVRHMRNFRYDFKDSEGFYTVHHSCVGAFVSLKNIYGDRYTHMDNVFTMNGAPPADKFIIKDLGKVDW